MSKTLKKKKHWLVKVQECSVSWGGSVELTAVLEVRGGAELGEFPHIGRVIPEAVVCHSGRLPGSGDVLLEVNGTPVSGLTNRDTLAVIRHFREPIRLKTVRPGGCPLVISPPAEWRGCANWKWDWCWMNKMRSLCLFACCCCCWWICLRVRPDSYCGYKWGPIIIVRTVLYYKTKQFVIVLYQIQCLAKHILIP